MKRVFQLGYALNLAGTETVFMNWYRNIDRSQLQFDFGVKQVYNTPLVEEIKQLGGHIYIISAGYGLYKRLRLLWYLYQTLKKHGPYDVFQSHDHFFAGLTCMVAWAAGVPRRITISHFADGSGKISAVSHLKRTFSRLLIALFSTNRLAVSQDAGQTLYGKHLSFQTIRNGIDTRKFAYNPILRAKKRRELGLENNFIVGHVGRFADQKNQTFLVNIFKKIYQRNPNARLILVGDGPDEAKIHHAVDILGLEKNVFFAKNQQTIQDWYQAFDVFVFPSFYEGLGIVAIEAQCSGLPCVMSDVIPKEAFVCNTTAVSLQKSPQEWADIILEKTKNFKRKDESAVIRQAGFDTIEVGKFIQQEYSK